MVEGLAVAVVDLKRLSGRLETRGKPKYAGLQLCRLSRDSVIRRYVQPDEPDVTSESILDVFRGVGFLD